MATAVDYGGMYAPNNALMGYLNRDTRVRHYFERDKIKCSLTMCFTITFGCHDPILFLDWGRSGYTGSC